MTQVSKRPLDKTVYARIFEIFLSSFAEIKSKDKAKTFLEELFSNSEQIMISKRLAIAFLLTKNYSFEAISKLLKVSLTTICHVNASVKNEKSALKAVLKKVESQKSEVGPNPFSYLLAILDTLLPPMRGTNWKVERRNQYQKLREIDNATPPF
jgi:uncharacterized protein YerC